MGLACISQSGDNLGSGFNLFTVFQMSYASIYWVDHLQDSGCGQALISNFEEGGVVDIFLQQKYIHWLLRSIKYYGTCLERYNGDQAESDTFRSRVQDVCRFIKFHRVAIESSPLQIYASCLIFSPVNSLTRICYQ
ncbi:hypothetical protein N7520_009139 [Penicillium odoratum]|uniref:uncharacterized protein n=1 Tax=Penicillium odoratum TaxID=1167516 RepID=UPI002547FFC6|nr:uncharacterized protein N7520_009139 [Penicillium odoratum]KAJ5752222.1 hypothetical protein N7520_009139 [Penicillium odoratum]